MGYHSYGIDISTEQFEEAKRQVNIFKVGEAAQIQSDRELANANKAAADVKTADVKPKQTCHSWWKRNWPWQLSQSQQICCHEFGSDVFGLVSVFASFRTLPLVHLPVNFDTLVNGLRSVCMILGTS